MLSLSPKKRSAETGAFLYAVYLDQPLLCATYVLLSMNAKNPKVGLFVCYTLVVSPTDLLDKYFSIFVRTFFADWKGDVLCYTCPYRGHWKEFDCGHWKKRQYLTTRWILDNCRPQCKSCNQHYDGRPETFEAELRDELGDARVEEINELSHKEFEHDERWILDQVTHYKNIVRSYL